MAKFIVSKDQHPKSVISHSVQLQVPRFQGKVLEVRPITPDDILRELEFFETQSMEDRYYRFFAHKQTLTKSELLSFVNIDYAHTNFGLVAIDPTSDSIVAIARYNLVASFQPVCTRCGNSVNNSTTALVVPDHDKSVEMAVAVHSTYQSLGLGKHLVSSLFEVARKDGVQVVFAEFLTTNSPAIRIFSAAATAAMATASCLSVDDGICRYEYRFFASPVS